MPKQITLFKGNAGHPTSGSGRRSGPEGRATSRTARLWREQGRPDAARDPLAPTYGWFAEGLDTPVLKEAKALLDEL